MIPQTYSAFKSHFQEHIHLYFEAYIQQKQDFMPNWLPEDAIAFPARGVLYLLEQRYGSEARRALNANEFIVSPVVNQADGAWLKHTNMVGVNVRTIGNFFNVVKYALTLPATQDSIHLLPIWEPGVVASLYGISSWNINPEFYSAELAEVLPHLDTVEKQLKITVNLLHLMGRTVGMDVIPHTDRYSEIALANPHYFEWLQRRDFEIVNHASNLHETVKQRILDWLIEEDSALEGSDFPQTIDEFFGENFNEEQRIWVLFGPKMDLWGRIFRRNQLIQWLFNDGYEPVPATMAPPYRGLAVSREESGKTIDPDGRVWRDYVITKPEPMSRVFGPLGRFRLFESKDNNANWEVDFDQPRKEVWKYVCEKFAGIARMYDFDFMRGDMSHVQMRPTGVPANPDMFYDIHKAVKNHIKQEKHYFGYFAESFLAPPGMMAYGDELDHLEASDTDSTLGDLQSMVVGTPEFLKNLGYYHELLKTRSFASNFTVITADKDDPRFDKFYFAGNESRMFIAFFLSDMPSYMGLGFEVRDIHELRATNEHYTKLYVFQLREGMNATHGPYQWGKNGLLFHNLTRLKLYADQILPLIQRKAIHWLLPPDATGKQKIVAWTQADAPTHIFVVNLNIQQAIEQVNIQMVGIKQVHVAFSTYTEGINPIAILIEDSILKINNLQAGEGRAYQVE